MAPVHYFAVTGKDGSFEIANLPAGEPIELQVWHEKAGSGMNAKPWTKGRYKVTLAADKTVDLQAIEVPADAAAAPGGVSIKLYPDADGRVGRIEVFGRDGSRLGLLDRGATGFAVRAGGPGAAARFSAVPLRISAQEAERDRSVVRRAFSTQLVGRQINVQRRWRSAVARAARRG